MLNAVEVRAGENLLASVAGVSVPPPEGWEEELRKVSPITNKFSHLRFYWYREKSRWVLYDCVPRCLIDPEVPQGAPILGGELLAALEGKPPRELQDWQVCQYVSDVQHEFYRLYKVYARPFWVLQGDNGGHQVKFSPWQQNVLIAKGLSAEAPVIGSLPPCPFDHRVIRQLAHLNRLHKLDNNLDKLQRSGTVEAADREMQDIQREIREAETKFIEEQMTPIVDMASSLSRGVRPRSEHSDQLIHVPSGTADRFADAYDQYLETGDFTAKVIW